MTCRTCEHSYQLASLWCLPKCDKPVDPNHKCKRFVRRPGRLEQLLLPGLGQRPMTPTRASLSPLTRNER